MKLFAVFFTVVILALFASDSAYAQAFGHFIQVDDGAGHTTVLKGQTIDPLDVFFFPVGGGILLTAPPVGVHSLVWLTAGNTGTGLSSSTPTDVLGTTNTFDVVMVANNVEKMRLVSGGGVSVSSLLTVTGANNFKYVDGNQTAGWILTESATGVASWANPGTLTIVSTAQGTAPITVNGDNAAHSGPITIALTTSNLTANGAVSVTNGTGSLAGSNPSAISLSTNATLTQAGNTLGINLANPNTWTVTQTFPAGSITNVELANSSINFTYGAGISGPASIALGASGLLTNTGVTSFAFTGGTLYGNIASATGAINLTPVLNTQTAATVFAGPISGVPAAPTFRVLANTDLPGSGAITVNGSTGLSVGGSPVSLGGTLTLTNTGVTSNIAGTGINVSAATGAVTISNTGILAITGSGAGINVTAGQSPVVTNTGVTSFAFTGGTLYGNVGAATGAVTLAPALNTQAANTVFAGPSAGPASAPTFRALVAGDLSGAAVTTATGTAPITVNADNAPHSGAITIAVTTSNLTAAGAVSVTNGVGSLVGSNPSAVSLSTNSTLSQTATLGINLGNANAWTGTQTFDGTGYTPTGGVLASPQQDNWGAVATISYIRISSPAATILTGIQNGSAGRTLFLQNVGSFTITLKSQNVGSAAVNQFDLPGGADIILGPKGAVSLIYDGTLGFWEVVSTN